MRSGTGAGTSHEVAAAAPVSMVTNNNNNKPHRRAAAAVAGAAYIGFGTGNTGCPWCVWHFHQGSQPHTYRMGRHSSLHRRRCRRSSRPTQTQHRNRPAADGDDDLIEVPARQYHIVSTKNFVLPFPAGPPSKTSRGQRRWTTNNTPDHEWAGPRASERNQAITTDCWTLICIFSN